MNRRTFFTVCGGLLVSGCSRIDQSVVPPESDQDTSFLPARARIRSPRKKTARYYIQFVGGDPSLNRLMAVDVPQKSGGITVYDILVTGSAKHRYSLNTQNYSAWGTFIDGINNTKTDRSVGRYWYLYVNGQFAGIGASNNKPKENSIVKWQYEKRS